MTRIAAFGPRPSAVAASELSWVDRELDLVIRRCTRRFPNAAAAVSLAPGIGLTWARAALAHDLPIEVWIPHPGMFDPWPSSVRAHAFRVLDRASALVVAHSEAPRFEPWMYGAHLKRLAEAAAVRVTVWDGDPQQTARLISRGGGPAYVLNYARRRSTWYPNGEEA